MKVFVTSITFALIMEGECIQSRLDRLHAQRKRVNDAYERSIDTFLQNPTDENRGLVEMYKECLDDVQEEITALINEL